MFQAGICAMLCISLFFGRPRAGKNICVVRKKESW
jgi:hypothetical protein